MILFTLSIVAIENTALIKMENSYFALMLKEENDTHYSFEKVQVKRGQHTRYFSELLNPSFDGKVLVKGAYYFN